MKFKRAFTNDGLRSPAPKFFYGATSNESCWYFGRELEQSVVDRIDSMLKAGSHTYDPTAPSNLECHEKILDLLRNNSDEFRMESGPFYWYQDAPGHIDSTELLDEADEHRLQGELASWRDALGYYYPVAASVDGGVVAAVCCSVRKSPTAHIAGCETESKFRRQGHASKAVACWANTVLGLNAVPLYNTTWANAASQKTAAATNAVQFAVGTAIY